MSKITSTLLLLISFLANSVMASTITATFTGRYHSGFYNKDGGVMEISAYDKTSKRLYAINGNGGDIHVIDLSTPSNPTFISAIALTAYGSAANSLAIKNNILAVAVEAVVKQNAGKVVFFNATDGTFINSVEVGSLPDMLTFTPDGSMVLVANEGEPTDDYTTDPEGSVSIIDISTGVANATVTTANFNSFDSQKATLINSGVRIYGGTNPTVSKDMEPEYIAISTDSKKAWVTCQENNAIAIVDLTTKSITDIKPLGYKDFNATGNGIDASDRYPGNPSTQINIANWPVKGMYQPDGIASIIYDNKTYLITANEGDARAYSAFSEEKTVSQLTLDAAVFPTAATLNTASNIGRLKVTDKLGDTDGDLDFDVLYAYGARSFSIWDDQLTQVYDSGDDIEQYVKTNFPANFNVNHNGSNQMSNRSDDKGPEPESVVTAVIDTKTYAFIALERQSAILIYNVTNPMQPEFVQYVSTRNFGETPVSASGTGIGTGGDLGPEGLLFIPAADSPNGKNLLIVSYEVSGTVAVYEIGISGTTSNNNLNGTKKIDVYPNPTTGSIVYLTQNIENCQIRSSTGQLLKEVANTNKIDIADLQAGVYFLNTNNGDIAKLIVQ